MAEEKIQKVNDDFVKKKKDKLDLDSLLGYLDALTCNRKRKAFLNEINLEQLYNSLITIAKRSEEMTVNEALISILQSLPNQVHIFNFCFVV